MKKIICLLLALVMTASFASVAISAEEAETEETEETEEVEEEKRIFEYDIYDSETFGYEYVYAGIFKKYSEVNKPWTLEDFPGVKAYSVVDTWAMSEETAARYKCTSGGTENFHQILKFDIIDKTPEGCLEAIRALEASEYVKSVNPQVFGTFYSTISPYDPFEGGGRVEGVSMFIGDVYGDGSLDLKDVLHLRRIVSGIEELEVITYADVNFDGSLDLKDVLKLRKMTAGTVYD